MFHGSFQPLASISCARREYEAIQLCVIPVAEEKTLRSVRVSCTTLRGQTTVINTENVEILVVAYIKTEPVDYPVIYKGEWPDPLIPQGIMAVDVEPEEMAVFWVEVYVPEATPPGIYEGRLKVDVENSHSLSVPLRVRVWNFEIPKEMHIPCITGLRGGVFTVSGEPGEEQRAYRSYVERFLRHRIFVGPPCTVPERDDPHFQKLDRELGWAIEKGLRDFVVRFDRKRPEEFVSLCNHLRRKGWLRYARVKVGIDEPDIEHYERVVKDAELVKRLVPDLRTFVTESPHPELIGKMDISLSDICTEREEWNRKAKEMGARIYYSMCHIPVRARFLRPQYLAPNMILDIPAVFHRVVFWIAWVNGIHGISFWGGNTEWKKDIAKLWSENLWPANWEGNWVYSGRHNGNGITVYPGKNGMPWGSIRMKVMRDGSEDYEYLWLLGKLLEGKGSHPLRKLLSPVPAVCVTTTNFNQVPSAILSYRKEIAEAIEFVRK